MKKILVYFSVILTMMMGVAGFAPGKVYADAVVENPSDCGNSAAFFSLRPWYHGLTTSITGRCEIGQPVDGKIPQFIWTIVLNILYDIMIMVGYIAIVMIAWGGYLYMFSRGLPDRAERGKKTLIAAAAGLAVAMLASVIMNTLVSILTNVS
ncbi:hypothetical protein J6D24_00590 [Candidatus Saccharibacteria bacterium]|nr:hypothetical protein [Candidatus Saccharibacteria bacterium]